jgi:hypothetical protein
MYGTTIPGGILLSTVPLPPREIETLVVVALVFPPDAIALTTVAPAPPGWYEMPDELAA